MMKNSILIIAITTILFSACEKILDIDIPDNRKHIVVNGIVNSDSLIQLQVSKSQNVLDTDDILFLTNASVKLYANNTLIEDLIHADSGVYVSNVIPEIGVDYKINVEYDNLKSVNAHIMLQNPAEIISIDTIIELLDNVYEGGESYGDEGLYQQYEIHYEVRIADTGNSNDYYFLALSRLQPIYDYENEIPVITGYEEMIEYYDSNDPVFRGSNNEYTLDKMYGKVFSDEIFNGKEYNIDISTNYFKDEFQEEPAKIYIKLLTVNSDIYRYITSFNLNQQSKYDPFAQPVQIYSNIENGLGLFSGYTMDVDSLILDF